MNPKVKLVLYLALAVALAVCVRGVLTAGREGAPGAGAAGTNSMATTNLVLTNATAAVTNTAATNATTASTNAAPDEGVARKSSARMGRFMAYGITGFFALVGLGVLIGYDVSRFFANRVEEMVFNDNLEGVKDPEYEEAEQAWQKGEYLEAVQLMRDYYRRNPSEVHVALRIAEIYETNLGNYLAAALEYEEVLKLRLSPERWGWAAIHLANLYSGKLNKTAAATALLHRLVDEFGQTAAAKKARERLGIPEPVEPPPPAPEPEPPAKKPPEEPPSNLPPGFRPK
jgi:TolA-binding protein